YFQAAGDLIYLIGTTKPEFGGSEIQRLLDGDYSGKAPSIDLQTEATRQQQILQAIEEGIIESAHDVAEGGVAVALAEKLFANQSLGLTVELGGDITTQLFSESQSRFIVSVKRENKARLEAMIDHT